MNNTKVCTKCGEEKNIEDFGKLKKGDKEYIRNACKNCHNLQSNKNRTKGIRTQSKPKVKNEIKLKHKESRDNDMSNIFSDKDIEVLKTIISRDKELFDLLDNRIDFEKIEDIKVKKSITISKFIHEKIVELAKNENVNYSQVVDKVLKKGLEHI